MRHAKTVAFAALISVFSAIPASAETLEKLRPLMRMTTPDGTGPFPAILMIPGCTGFNIKGGNYDETQADLTKLGFAVARVDSLEARGEKQCDKHIVTAKHQASDVKLVVEHLKALPSINSAAINVLGWSWGGQGVLASAQADTGIAKAIAYYPACQRLDAGQIKVPTLVLFGEADDVVSLAKCKEFLGGSTTVTLRTYPGAHHAFNNKNFDPPRKYRFGTLGYNEQGAAAAWKELQAFLAR